MNTYLLSKLATFAGVLILNGLIIAGVGYLFDLQIHPDSGEIARGGDKGGNADADYASVPHVYTERCPDSHIYNDTTRRSERSGRTSTVACTGVRGARSR